MRRSHLVLLFVILVVLMFAMPLVTKLRLEWKWLMTAVLFFTLLMVAGALMPVVERRMAWGVLIDPLTNTMSLSRLQIVLWTWLILSAFLTLALARVADAQQQPALYKCSPTEPQTPTGCQPLDIQLPVELWALLGISLTTAVATPLLKTDKARRTADHDAAADQAHARAEIQFEAAQSTLPQQTRDQLKSMTAPPARTYRAVLERRQLQKPPQAGTLFEAAPQGDSSVTGEEPDRIPVGAIAKKAKPSDAAFSDLFTGDEGATYGYIDVAKLQNLFFTLIVAATYAAAIWQLMVSKQAAGFFAFPDLTSGQLALLGISHAGFLANTAATRTVPQ